jgi:GDP-L-fucose synthase
MCADVKFTDELSVDENDEISIRDLANSIVKVMNHPDKPEVRSFVLFTMYLSTDVLVMKFENEVNDNGQDRKPASNAKLMSLIGSDFKFTPFEQGFLSSFTHFSP